MSKAFQENFKTFLFTYQHEGAEWVIEIQARDKADALVRCAKLAYARLDGELVAKVPHSMGWIARLAVWFGNLLSKPRYG